MIGILFLILAIVAACGLAMTVKTANAKGLVFGQFLATNYLVAVVISLLSSGGDIRGLDSSFISGLGVFVGCMYVLSLWLFNKAITAMGLALPTALMRLSAILPTLGSLMIFHEQSSVYQLLGIVLAFCSLPLAGNEPIRFDRAIKSGIGGLKWGVALFFVYGFASFAFKVHAEWAPISDPKSLMIVIFGTASLLTFPQFFKGPRLSKQCIMWGAILGFANALATYFLVGALAFVPGYLVYPTVGIGVIALTTLAGLLIWNERLRSANYTFLALAGLAVLVINLG